MPKLTIYISEDEKEVIERLKYYIALINKKFRAKLSLSDLVVSYLSAVLKRLEEKDIDSIRDLRDLKIPTLQINFDNFNVDISNIANGGKPTQVDLSQYVLETKIKEWRSKINYIEYLLSKGNNAIAKKQILNMRKDINQTISKYKKAPKFIADEISNILAQLSTLEEDINEFSYT